MTCSNQKFKTCYFLTIYTDEVIIFIYFLPETMLP